MFSPLPVLRTLLVLLALVASLQARPQNQIAAAGDGPFVVDIGDVQPPDEGRLRGLVLADTSEEALSIYADRHLDGGLARIHQRMDMQGKADALAPQIELAHSRGLRVLLTVVATPLWNASNFDGPELPIGLPPYARSAPKDSEAWARDVVTMLEELENGHGLLPDYIEIWNEPDRHEWWSGSRDQILELIEHSCREIKARFPQVKVGGTGLARHASTMEAPDSVLSSLLVQAAQKSHPLDFLSWHHYGPSGGLRYYDPVGQFRAEAQALGLKGLEHIVTEWNVYPSPINNPWAIEFDGPHAAAQLAGFLSGAAATGLDAQSFFMTVDLNDPRRIPDLTGSGMGQLTPHGLKKPSFRVMSFLAGMATENKLQVEYPDQEFAASLYATRNGNRVRMVIGNDVLPGRWLWARACTERGTLPGKLWVATQAVGYRRDWLPPVGRLMQQGLTEYEANVVREVLPMAFEAEDLERGPRTVEIRLENAGSFMLSKAWCFNDTSNNPVHRRTELEPVLQGIEDAAWDFAWDEVVRIVRAAGLPAPKRPADFEDWVDAAELGAALGLSNNVASKAWTASRDGLESGRYGSWEMLNTQPATRLTPVAPVEAGVQRNGKTIEIVLEPNSVVVLDVQL